VAVTDHNQVEGALAIAKQTDFLIIPGIEVSSLNGHIVGLNINEAIPRGLSVDETVDLIHKAGGIAIACHPFALFKRSIGKHISVKFDAVEAINASAFPFRRATRQAHMLADRLKLPKVAGTDAHYAPVIGQAYTLIDAEANVEAIIKAIVNGKCGPAGTAMSLAMRLENQVRFFWKSWKKGKRYS
jgi:predicted metal-dependent phosphoesterase TrpH